MPNALKAFILFYVLSATGFANDNQETLSHNIYFSLENEFGGPKEETKDTFDCSDKIFTVVELNNYDQSEHQLSVKWIDPSLTTREHTQYPFHIHKDQTKVWAWLSLSRATGAGLVQWIDPAAGLEEFIGQWSVEVRVDNKLIEKKNFQVIC